MLASPVVPQADMGNLKERCFYTRKSNDLAPNSTTNSVLRQTYVSAHVRQVKTYKGQFSVRIALQQLDSSFPRSRERRKPFLL